MKSSQKKRSESAHSHRIQPLILVVILGVIALAFTFVNSGTSIEEDRALTQEALQEEWEKLEAEALEEQKRITEEARVKQAQEQEETEPTYSGDILFTLDTISARRRGDDYGVIDGMSYTITNDVAFEKELQLSVYVYDDDDDTLLRNKPRATFEPVVLAPGESFTTESALHIGFNQLDIAKELKFRIKDELDVIIVDDIIGKDFSYLMQEEVWDELEGIDIIPYDIGFDKRDDNFGVIRNMTLSVHNNLPYPQDLEIAIYLFDENDESVMRNEVYRRVKFTDLLPGERQTKSFQLRISFNELDMMKTLRFKATNAAKVVIADVEFQKSFADADL